MKLSGELVRIHLYQPLNVLIFEYFIFSLKSYTKDQQQRPGSQIQLNTYFCFTGTQPFVCLRVVNDCTARSGLSGCDRQT